MKLALWGTFDVDNYGDLLFPIIAEHHCPDIKWYFVSPTNDSTSFKDSLDVINFYQIEDINVDGILIGGGNIINLNPTNLDTYKNVSEFAYPNLWLGAAKLALSKNIGYAFNAPGISNLNSNFFEKLLYRAALDNSAYNSFRENYSVRFAKKHTKKEVNWVPDTAFTISKVWPLTNDLKENTIVFNLNERYHSPINETAKWMDRISESLNLEIKLVVIGGCHNDLQFTNDVAKYLKMPFEIVESKSLKEIALTIGKAKFFIGSSMHGFITALSYNTPALLKLNNHPLHKFLDAVEIAELNQKVICASWEKIFENLYSPALLRENVREKIFEKLDLHWKEVIKKLESDERKSFSLALSMWKQILLLDKLTSYYRKRIRRKFSLN